MHRTVILVFVALTLSLHCRPAPRSEPAREQSAIEYEPGTEPLETASIGSDEVQTLEAPRAAAPAPGRPCAWSRSWQQADVPNPLLAGVGGVPMPVKTNDIPVMVPGHRPGGPGEIVAEIVIGPDGDVLEASIVDRPVPPWPEAEEAILKAVRQWTYEPMTLDGTPISVCTTVVMTL